MVDIFELKPLTETTFFDRLNVTQTIYLIFFLLHNDLLFLTICYDQHYQRPFQDQQICQKQNYLHQKISLLIQLDWEVHGKFNVVESQIVGDILICISQEIHKFCYTSAFPRGSGVVEQMH